MKSHPNIERYRERTERILELHNAGLSLAEIGKEMGTGKGSIFNTLKRQGITRTATRHLNQSDTAYRQKDAIRGSRKLEEAINRYLAKHHPEYAR